MKQAARFSVLAGFSILFAACSGGGSSSGGGGALFVQSCSLSCSNGVGGNQVSCGLVNTFQNQDVALVFSSPINASTVNSNTFQVIDTGTGAVPPGSYVVSGNKVSFRPRLTFDASGNPTFGFVDGGTYQIRVPGTSQGDIGPFMQSTNGKPNAARVLCTITTDQGLIDAVPGNPTVTIWVTAINPTTLATAKKKVDSTIPNDPLVILPTERVATNSDIEFVFNDLMNLGTVVIPALAQAPFITINTDTDGDFSTLGDQVPLAGTYTFAVGQTSFVDQTNLQTAVRFRPTNGFPNSGSNPNALRQVVIDVPNTVRDLKGNGVANSGKRAVTPQEINYTTVVVPTGGEKFTTTTNLDSKRTGAYWGADVGGGVAGQLVPGQGGGSGRFGDLVVDAGTTLTLHTSPVYAQGRITMTINPKPADAAYLQINTPASGTQYLFKKAVTSPTTEIKIGDFIGDTLREMAVFLNTNAAADPEIAQCRFWVENSNQLVCEYKTIGTAGNAFQLRIFPASVASVVGGSIPAGQAYSEGTLSGGVDYVEFGDDDIRDSEESLLTNLFGAVDGGPVDHYFSDDGVFEFATIDVQAGATLRFVGDNPPRLYSRGTVTIADTATIDISGVNNSAHVSANPIGQAGGAVVDLAQPFGFRLLGGRPGPGGGFGGQGADRSNHPFVDCLAGPTTSLTCLANGGTAANPIVNHALTEFYAPPLAITLDDGSAGEGVGGALGYGPTATTGLGDGQGGSRWPVNFPSATNVFADMATNGTCKSEQVAAPGSGGAYATDGTSGTPTAANASATFPAATANTPAPAVAGDSTEVNLEPAATPGPRRALTPESGFLRGGAGGGGGGAHIADTTTSGGGATCFGASAAINVFRDHSAAAGGGGGGAIQVVAGRKVQFDGRIDASGGDGGDVSTSGLSYGLFAVPGGGGSGGGVLMQAREFAFGLLPNRIDVNGGLGGAGNFAAAGGDGGVGLVRVESGLALLQSDVALKVTPTDALDPNSAQWLSVDAWTDQTVRPSSYSGAQSCWMRVPGSFFALSFDSDVVGGAYGWDMELVVNLALPAPNNGVRRINYRNPAAPGVDPVTGIPAATFSTVWGGNTSEANWGVCIDAGTLPAQCSLGGAPIIVRFQGARAGSGFVDACNTDVDNTLQVVQDSLTPWVTHPDELNVFSPQPDMIRYQIVFDRSHPDFASIQSITNIRINVTPD